MRTLILILICSAFVAGGVLDARTGKGGKRHVLGSALVALFIGLVVCWLLVYVVGIFDDWKFSLRRYLR